MGVVSFIFTFVIGIPSSIFRAYVACQLWAWFVVPQFHTAPLSKAVAFGIFLFLETVHPTRIDLDEDEGYSKKEKYVRHGVKTLLWPLITAMGWLSGYIVHLIATRA